jgi:hypothetical protein
MLDATDTSWAPWHIVRSDSKKNARLNCIKHLLSQLPYEKVERPKVRLPKRSMKHAYDDVATMKDRRWIPVSTNLHPERKTARSPTHKAHPDACGELDDGEVVVVFHAWRWPMAALSKRDQSMNLLAPTLD